MKRFLLIDDHEVVRIGLKKILTDTFSTILCGEAGNVPDAIKLTTQQEWDLIVIEISLGSNGGLDLLKEIKRLRPKIPVLVLTFHGEQRYALRAIKAGAAGYVTKVSHAHELLNAVRKALQGGRYVSPSLAETLSADLHRNMPESFQEILSDREFQVMRLIGSGKTVGQIALLLSISDKTVSTYRARILEKTGFKNNAEMIRYAVENDFVD